MRASIIVLGSRPLRPGVRRRTVLIGIRHVVAALLSLFFFVPFVVAVLTSIKPNASAETGNALSLPHPVTFSNYASVFDLGGFAGFTKTSVVVSVVATVVQVSVSVLAGYGLAKLKFRGRNAMFGVVLITLMLPVEALALPLFLEILHAPLVGGNSISGSGGIGLQASDLGLMAPYLVSGFSIFLARQFFSGLPFELGQAARIDGCSEWGVFWRIYRPLASPLIVIVALFSFQSSWVAFLWPLITSGGPAHFTLQVGLSAFQQEYTAQWGDLMAAAIIASLPVLGIFIFGQRYLRRGIAWSGGRG